MSVINKDLALAIAKKLGAVIEGHGKAHDIAVVRHKGKVVATFGIRRGSRKDLGHDHVPEQIFLRPREARLLGQCPLSREEWVGLASGRGMI